MVCLLSAVLGYHGRVWRSSLTASTSRAAVALCKGYVLIGKCSCTMPLNDGGSGVQLQKSALTRSLIETTQQQGCSQHETDGYHTIDSDAWLVGTRRPACGTHLHSADI